jgi:hypothetical protein
MQKVYGLNAIDIEHADDASREKFALSGFSASGSPRDLTPTSSSSQLCSMFKF